MRGQNKELVASRILDAVIWCKYQADSVDIQITQVAARAGISSRTLNRYFPDKEKLFGLAAGRFVQAKFAEYEERSKAAVLMDKNGLERLLSFIENMMEYISSDPEDAKQLVDANFYYVGGAVDGNYWKASFGDRIKSAFSEDITEGIRDGSIRADINPQEIAPLISATFNGIMQKLLLSVFNPDKTTDRAEALKVCDSYIKVLRLHLSATD